MVDYEAILNKSWGDIPKDQVLPSGSWLLRGRNATFQPPKEDGQSGRFLFVYSVKEALSDVSDGALAALGDYDVTSKQIFFTMFVERPRDWDALRSHLAKHSGISVTNGASIADTLNQFKGSEVVSYLDTKTFQTKGGDTVTDNDPVSFDSVS